MSRRHRETSAASPEGDAWLVLDGHEASVVDAMAARVIPSEPDCPGAREAKVVRFIDRTLAETATDLLTVYREGVRLIEGATKARHPGRGFTELAEGDQDRLLLDTWRLALTGLTAQQSRRLALFFATVREHTIQGMFCDPEYGGNADAVGWRLVGFPGAQWGYDADQMRPNYDASTIPVTTLEDLRRSLTERPSYGAGSTW